MKLKELRLKAKLLQRDVAEALNVDRSTVAKWEAGESFPRSGKLKALASLYKCSIDELLA